jgi:hypothetical protein
MSAPDHIDAEAVEIIGDDEGTEDSPAAPVEQDGGEEAVSRKSPASEVVRLVKSSGAELFHNAAGRAFAGFEHEGHRETWPVKSRAFRLFARHLFYESKGAAPSTQAVTDAVATLEAEAIYRGQETDVYLRVAEEEGAIYIDLGDARWRCVAIDRDGWRVLDRHPVYLRRTPNTAALPEPIRGGKIDDLRRFVNLPDDDAWRLFVACIVAYLRPRGPYPVLNLDGEQGSAKSTAARIVRELIDPAGAADLRSTPHGEQNLMVAANGAWVLAFDNLSHVQKWLSDAICRLATGGGFSTRELYTDEDEVVIEAQRPVVINGIGDLATESDLLDRSVILNLPTISEANRRDEEGFWTDFYAARPKILGALFDAVAVALRRVESVRLDRKPRMADFALWVTAAEPGLGWEDGVFMESYDGNRKAAYELALEASPVGPAIVTLAGLGFEGTAGELLSELEGIAGEKAAKHREWPKNARALSAAVKRLTPDLRALDFEVERSREEGKARRRIITLAPADIDKRGQDRPNRPNRPNTHKVSDANPDGSDARGAVRTQIRTQITPADGSDHVGRDQTHSPGDVHTQLTTEEYVERFRQRQGERA